jgi:hypothetical protein
MEGKAAPARFLRTSTPRCWEPVGPVPATTSTSSAVSNAKAQCEALHDGMLGASAEAGMIPQSVAVACLALTGIEHRPTVEAALEVERSRLLAT